MVGGTEVLRFAGRSRGASRFYGESKGKPKDGGSWGGRGEGGVRRGWIVRGVDGSRTVDRGEQRDNGHAGCRLGGNDQENLEQGVEKAPAQKRADKRAQGDKGGQKKRQADEDKEHGGSWVAPMNGASIGGNPCQDPGDNPGGGGSPSGVEEDVEEFSWAGSPGGWDSRGERRGKPRAVECPRLQSDGKTPPLPPCRHGAAPSAKAGILREVPGLGRSGSGTASLFASQMTGHLPPSP